VWGVESNNKPKHAKCEKKIIFEIKLLLRA
jgi:hypothetical protein